MKNPIEEILDMRPLEEAIDTKNADIQISKDNLAISSDVKTQMISHSNASENLDDVEKARKNIDDLIEVGKDSLVELISLAKQSQSPRAFEVATGLMKTLLEANKDFVDISSRKKYIKEEIENPKDEKEASTNITNNNLILSTADLLKMIKGD